MTSINVAHLLSACLSLSRQAGVIIRSVRASGDLNTIQKNGAVDDPCTVADTRSQALIVSGLRSVWPSLCIIGEEDPSSLPAVADTQERPSLNLVDETGLAAELRAVPLEEVSVFIDPLDATKEFTNGVLPCVMTLVGICVKGDPVAAVMNQVFAGENGRAVYGARGLGVMGLEPPVRVRPVEHQGKFVVVTSASHGHKALDDAIALVAPDVVIREGGCGYKCLLVMQGVADSYLYPVTGTSRWDTCAPEALLRILKGDLTDRHGKRIVYDPLGGPPAGTWKNASLVASSTLHLHERVLKALSKM